MPTPVSFRFKPFCRIFTRGAGPTGLLGRLQGLRKASALAVKTAFSGPAGAVALVNEAEAPRTPVIGLANEITATAGDGWALIPYGDHPNERGLQPFGRAEAEEMVGYFKNTWQRLKRAFVGMPILRGHPDMATTVRKEMDRQPDAGKRAALQSLINSIERRYPDKTVYGTIADMEARDEGLALRPVLTEAGAALVNESGLKFFSPHWLCRPGEPKAGQPTQIPAYMVSIGLTDRPNIAGTSLVNEEAGSAEEISPMNKTLILQLLAALGRPLANEATDEQLTAGLTEALPLAQGLAARPETTALVNEQSRVTEITGKLTAAETALANERAAVAAAQEAHAVSLVSHAVAAGRITEAARPVWLGRLKRDFAAESVALANEAPVVKTRPITGDLGARKPAAAAREKFTALVNERTAKGEDYTAAWTAVKATKEGKALIAEMEQTAPATA